MEFMTGSWVFPWVIQQIVIPPSYNNVTIQQLIKESLLSIIIIERRNIEYQQAKREG